MDAHVLKKLADLNALADLGDGRKGVRVSLQYQGELHEKARGPRRAILRAAFEKIASVLAPDGVALDFDSLSVSGQTMEAVLPVDRVHAIEQHLENEHVRVDPLIDRQVL